MLTMTDILPNSRETFDNYGRLLDALAPPVAVDDHVDALVARYRDALTAWHRLNFVIRGVADEVMDAATLAMSAARDDLRDWMGERGQLAVISRTHRLIAVIVPEVCPDECDCPILYPLGTVAGLDA